ncbi:hypothetical protein RRG08_022842 [Elysia crispata]|uniref:Uncharacterized protein n=1 Tax=Elysia crispata TaxID=231223 RepID=A0AAE1D8Q6_9GAST|nr:hypothetical protein RRG08_022842 [Elysia crispata]
MPGGSQTTGPSNHSTLFDLLPLRGSGITYLKLWRGQQTMAVPSKALGWTNYMYILPCIALPWRRGGHSLLTGRRMETLRDTAQIGDNCHHFCGRSD